MYSPVIHSQLQLPLPDNIKLPEPPSMIPYKLTESIQSLIHTKYVILLAYLYISMQFPSFDTPLFNIDSLPTTAAIQPFIIQTQLQTVGAFFCCINLKLSKNFHFFDIPLDNIFSCPCEQILRIPCKVHTGDQLVLDHSIILDQFLAVHIPLF